ncbi:hypothetical protein F2P81_016589 [Scophthalmus maximus]|uniref:Uncharacterized protein n=1 Tax=Scophthalmus maximus TaxID=52904 RepID=A0A6A4SLV1_SCOMX|nr:hypothetical protein F2P81_016589 [Scophthalmus maximus]
MSFANPGEPPPGGDRRRLDATRRDAGTGECVRFNDDCSIKNEILLLPSETTVHFKTNISQTDTETVIRLRFHNFADVTSFTATLLFLYSQSMKRTQTSDVLLLR